MGAVRECVHKDLLKRGAVAKESELAGEVTFNSIRLCDLELGLAIGGGFGEEGHDTKGSGGLVLGPVTLVDVGESGVTVGADHDDRAGKAAMTVEVEVSDLEGAVGLVGQGVECVGLSGVEEGVCD